MTNEIFEILDFFTELSEILERVPYINPETRFTIKKKEDEYQWTLSSITTPYVYLHYFGSAYLDKKSILHIMDYGYSIKEAIEENYGISLREEIKEYTHDLWKNNEFIEKMAEKFPLAFDDYNTRQRLIDEISDTKIRQRILEDGYVVTEIVYKVDKKDSKSIIEKIIEGIRILREIYLKQYGFQEEYTLINTEKETHWMQTREKIKFVIELLKPFSEQIEIKRLVINNGQSDTDNYISLFIIGGLLEQLEIQVNLTYNQVKAKICLYGIKENSLNLINEIKKSNKVRVDYYTEMVILSTEKSSLHQMLTFLTKILEKIL
jgi:hypothetical protein